MLARVTAPAAPAPHRAVDVAVIGGGIIGCSAAAMLANRGLRVLLIERATIAAGASGRNLGAVQHPFDAALAPLYVDSLARYRALADRGDGFGIGHAPAGLLLLNRDADAAARQVERFRVTDPDLDATFVDPDEVVRVEPSLRHGPAGVLLATGYPVPPAAATEAWADLAAQSGASLLVGTGARPAIESGRAVGVLLDDGTAVAADAVLVAAGPWTPPLVDPSGAWRPIRPTYGVTLQLRLGDAAPTRVVEEDEVDVINRPDAATARAAGHIGDEPPSLFSIATAGGTSTLGSTFLATEPDAAAVEPLLLRRAAAFLPAVAEAEIVGRRLCARPQSVDGRPFIGPVAGMDGLHVCAGHGPWGISTGPGSAAVAVRALLDGVPPPPELAAARPI